MNKGDGQITERRQDLRSLTSTHPRAILSKGNITDIMESILDTPVATVEF
jgi:hypothetical protein